MPFFAASLPALKKLGVIEDHPQQNIAGPHMQSYRSTNAMSQHISFSLRYHQNVLKRAVREDDNALVVRGYVSHTQSDFRRLETAVSDEKRMSNREHRFDE